MIRPNVIVSGLYREPVSLLDRHWETLHDYFIIVGFARNRGSHVADDDLEVARIGGHATLEVVLLLPLHEAVLLKESCIACHSFLIHVCRSILIE
jgi:hypothetical protein